MPEPASVTLLDLGSGSGDIPRDLRDLFASHGVAGVAITLDRDPTAVALARRAGSTVVRGDALRLPLADGSIDLVTTIKMAHHFSGAELSGLIAEMARVARRRVIVLDIRRHWLAYWGFIAWSRLWTRNRLVRADGPLSVLRGFTAAELMAATAALPGFAWSVRSYAGFQLALVGRRRDAMRTAYPNAPPRAAETRGFGFTREGRRTIIRGPGPPTDIQAPEGRQRTRPECRRKDFSSMVSEDLLALLVCPMGKAPLRREGNTLICTRCGPRFEIKDDIPNMLIEEAELPRRLRLDQGPGMRPGRRREGRCPLTVPVSGMGIRPIADAGPWRSALHSLPGFVNTLRLDDSGNPRAGQVENLRQRPLREPMLMGQTDHQIAPCPTTLFRAGTVQQRRLGQGRRAGVDGSRSSGVSS